MFFFFFFVFHHFLQDLGTQSETRSWQRLVRLLLLNVVDISILNPMTLQVSTASGGKRQRARFSSCPQRRSQANSPSEDQRDVWPEAPRLSFTWPPVDTLPLRSRTVLFLTHGVAKCVAMAPQVLLDKRRQTCDFSGDTVDTVNVFFLT